MDTKDYLKVLVEEIHSSTVATIGADGHPQTRVIDLMLHDSEGVYFLTAKGKEFYTQLMEQGYISLSAVKDKKSISLRGRIRNIGKDRLEDIFEKNPYMKQIYPEGRREPLEVFCLYEAEGSFFDISDPSHVTRGEFRIGQPASAKRGYYVEDGCIGCHICASVCPQDCIDISVCPVVIDQSRCLHCGACLSACPVNAVVKY